MQHLAPEVRIRSSADCNPPYMLALVLLRKSSVSVWEGEVLAKSRSRTFRDEVLTVTLKADRFHNAHTRACHNLQTRRPEIYGRLVDPA